MREGKGPLGPAAAGVPAYVPLFSGYDSIGRWTINLLVLFVVAAVTLGLEVLLTRVFSVVLFASHSFLAISLALLGTGSGALIVYFGKPLEGEALRRRRTLLLAVFSVTVLVSLWGLLQIEFVPQTLETPNPRQARGSLSFVERVSLMERNPGLFNAWKLYGAIPLAFLPFFFAGYLQAIIFRSAPGKFARMYGFDLIGATFGSIFIPLLLYPFGLRGTAFITAAVALVPVIWELPRERTFRMVSTLVAPVLVMAALWATGSFQIQYAAGFSEKDLIREHWSPMSRVALMNYRNQHMYVIDNGSRTFYVPRNERTVKGYMRSLYTIPFEMKRGGDLLVIASGGGQEITMASHFGMKRIEAVEIARPIVTDILENRKNEPGNPYLLPNVRSHIADGRSVVMRSKDRFDVIQMLDVNFATVAGQISLAWSPNFVSTQEAFSEYMGHLKEDGFLCYTMFSGVRSPIAGEKGRRLVSLVAGMKLAGVARPDDHLVILSRPLPYGFQTLYLAKKTPFLPDEVSAIYRIARARGAKIKMLFPEPEEITGGEAASSESDRAAGTGSYLVALKEICRQTDPIRGVAAGLAVANGRGVPLTDDRPYLVGSGLMSEGSRFESLISGLYTPLLKVMGVLAFVFLLLPFIVRRPGGGERVKIDVRLVLILALTGVGFMFLEMGGIYKYQLYLHHPTLAMIVVLSSMILGAGLGSLHSGTIRAAGKEKAIALSSLGAVIASIALFLAVPLWGHEFLLSLPIPVLLPIVFLAFAALGFLLGHVVPLSIDRFSHGQSNLLAWCWAITVTGSVFGTVLASILARDYGMLFVAVLGIFCYLSVGAVILTGKAAAGMRSRDPDFPPVPG